MISLPTRRASWCARSSCCRKNPSNQRALHASHLDRRLPWLNGPLEIGLESFLCSVFHSILSLVLSLAPWFFSRWISFCSSPMTIMTICTAMRQKGMLYICAPCLYEFLFALRDCWNRTFLELWGVSIFGGFFFVLFCFLYLALLWAFGRPQSRQKKA